MVPNPDWEIFHRCYGNYQKPGAFSKPGLVFRNLVIVFRNFLIVFRKLAIVFRKLAIVFRKLAIVLRKLAIVLRNLGKVLRNLWIVFRNYVKVFGSTALRPYIHFFTLKVRILPKCIEPYLPVIISIKQKGFLYSGIWTAKVFLTNKL